MSVYVSANFIVGWISWLFTIQASRLLTIEQLAVLSVFTSLTNILSVLPDAISTTISRFAAYWNEKKSEALTIATMRLLIRTGFVISISIIGLALVFERSISDFFKITPLYLRIFAPIIFFLFLKSIFFGFLKAQLALKRISLILIISALTKLALINLAGMQSLNRVISLAILALVGSELIAFTTSLFFALKEKYMLSVFHTGVRLKTEIAREIYSFLFNSLFAKIGFVIINSIDFLLVKHYFSQKQAGQYALLVIMGNILYFGAKMLFTALIPLVSREQAQGRSGYRPMFLLTGMVGFAGLFGLFLYWQFPLDMMRFFIKKQDHFVASYLLPYSGAMYLLAIASCISTFNIAKKNFLPSRFYIAGSAIIAIVIFLNHNRLQTVALLSAFILSITALTMIVYESIRLKKHISRIRTSYDVS